MEIYSTGTMTYQGQKRHYLRIKSTEDIVLPGNQIQHIEELVGQTVTYDFCIRDMIREEKADGFYYKWYVLESMSKVIDRTPALEDEIAQLRSELAEENELLKGCIMELAAELYN